MLYSNPLNIEDKMGKRPKKCEYCKNIIENRKPFQVVCNYQCALGLKKLKAAKVWNKEKKQLKEALKTRSDWLADLEKIFNRFIRLRDKGHPCISCETTNPKIIYSAGHFHSKGAYPNIRFNEDNVHLQCLMSCNKSKGGNIHEYRPRLIEKIGVVRFNHLQKVKNEPLKISIDEIKEKMKYYRLKNKEMK